MIKVTEKAQVEEIANVVSSAEPRSLRSISSEYYILRDKDGISLVRADNLTLTYK